MQSISFPTPPNVVKKEERTASIEIGSLYPGYGTTLGNAIRRILLSSLPGSAITSVKIEGADHEFTTFPNVKEDLIHILLNLKQVRFKFHAAEPVTVKMSVKGEKVVTAGDFESSSDAEVVNKDLLIATLTDKKATFDVEAEVSPGLGYEPIERRNKEKLPVGRIALDATFTPVRKANFKVENMRVGDRTDFNKLVFEIETDGSIEPDVAFKKAVEILDQHVEILNSFEVKEEKETKKKSEKGEK